MGIADKRHWICVTANTDKLPARTRRWEWWQWWCAICRTGGWSLLPWLGQQEIVASLILSNVWGVVLACAVRADGVRGLVWLCDSVGRPGLQPTVHLQRRLIRAPHGCRVLSFLKDELRHEMHVQEMLACVRNEQGVAWLLAAGADVCEREGFMALCRCAEYGDVRAVQRLLEAGVGKESTESVTPLFRAAQSGHVDVVRVLLAAGVDANECEYVGGLPLCVAASIGHEAVVRALLDAGADPCVTGSDGICALYAAAQNGNAGVVRMLLEAGADVRQGEDTSGQTAMSVAVRNNQTEVIRLLSQWTLCPENENGT